MTKDLICTPVILSMRNFIKHEFDNAWLELSTTDTDTILYAAKKTATAASRAADPDELKITFRILNKILSQTGFSKFMDTATVYGVRGRVLFYGVLCVVKNDKVIVSSCPSEDDISMMRKLFFSRLYFNRVACLYTDTRTWTCVLEESYYHPRVLK